MYRIPAILLIALTALAFNGCGDNDPAGSLQVGITDAPVDTADAVVIHFSEVLIHAADGTRTTIPVTDPVTRQPGRSIDLLAQTGGKQVVLFEQSLPAGQYNWMRLDVDFDETRTYIEIGPNRYPLRCTSCEQNGVKLNRSFTIDADQTTAFTLDFDLRKSINFSKNGYHLRPTVRVVVSSAAGSIEGAIDSALIGGDPLGCAVYVYEGHDITPDDIYLPDGNIPAVQHNNPVTTARVTDIGNNNYRYTAAFLPAGQYTLALSCEAANDIAETDDDISFSTGINARVAAGQSTTVTFN